MSAGGRLFSLSVCLSALSVSSSDSGAVVLNSGNIDEVLAANEFVFLNFYADWCRFSNMLAPEWDKLADQAAAKFDKGKILVGKVDCDKESSLGSRFHITKYPTLKYVRNGAIAKREYRGKRSVEAFIEFLEEQTRDPVKQIADLSALNELDSKKRHVIGYFESQTSTEYSNFRRSAINLKDDCEFHGLFGDTSSAMHPPGQSIVAFRPNKARSNDDDETFKGNLFSMEELSKWMTEKCTPLVREITFENAEELTEEGLPFLILFHAPEDDESIKKFTETVQQELMEDKQNVNFLIADGVKFAHPLHHLGKSKEDLPLIAIDSFRHMYLFPKYEDMQVPGKLKEFLKDLYSGKLHREFHYGPDKEEGDGGASSSSSETAPGSDEAPSSNNEVHGDRPRRETGTKDPPPSQFQHLGPSKNRYTLLHDEF